MPSFFPGSIRSSANFVRALRRASIRLTDPSAGSRPVGRRKPVCRRAFPSPSARSMRTSAPSAPASRRARSSRSSAPAPATSPSLEPEETRGRPRPVRHRRRQRAARLFRPGSRPVRRGRHLQLVRQLSSARRQSRHPRGADGRGGKIEAGRIRPARARLEQRQPHHSGGPTPHRPARSARRFTRRRRKFTARSSKPRPSAR